MELKVGKSETAYQGRVEFKTGSHCWLMGKDGRLHQVALNQVSSFRKVSPTFKKQNLLQIRSELRKEFGRNFDVQGGKRYVVCAEKGKAKTYLKWFEEVSRDFSHYFRVRNLTLPEAEFNMVAIVFPDRKQFTEYSRSIGVAVSSTLRGYYHPVTNRVILYDSSSSVAQRLPVNRSAKLVVALPEKPFEAKLWENNKWGSNKWGTAGLEDLRNTIIHEGTHQVAFNRGLHSRIGSNPRWVVEGLAMVFESEGLRSGTGRQTDRLNRERFLWFNEYRKKRRAKKSLATFLKSDQLFQTAALDAYSEAWALSFYLLETRPRKYIRYLKLVSRNSRGRNYTGSERLQDFRRLFHENLEWLEVDYLRFYDKLAK